MRKVSLWWGLVASAAILAAGGCKSTSSNSPTASTANPVNGSGTRSALVAGDDPLSLNTKTPPPGPDLYVSTAHFYEGNHDLEAAKGQYDRALKIDPAYLPALLGYAQLLDMQKEFLEADKLYEKAANKHSDVAAVYNDWGMSQQRRGHFEESVKLLTKATRLKPEKQLYRNNLAMVLVVLHRPQEAYRQLAAIEAPSVAHFNLAAVLHRNGDDQMAAYHFAEAAKEDPSCIQARQWAERLGGVGAPAPNNAIAIAGEARVPPPDPRPDPAAAQYVASRPPIVEQATASSLPEPGPQPSGNGSASYGSGNNSATTVAPASAEGLPAFAGVQPGPVVTPTSGISYPVQYPPMAAPSASGAAEPPSPEALPPLPPGGSTTNGSPANDGLSRGLTPLPPVQ